MKRALRLALPVSLLACGGSGTDVTSPGYTGPIVAGHWCAAVGAAPSFVAVTFTQTDSTLGGTAVDNLGSAATVHASTITGKYGAGFEPVTVTFSNFAGNGPNTFTGTASVGGAGVIDLRSQTDDSDLYLVADAHASLSPCAGHYP